MQTFSQHIAESHDVVEVPLADIQPWERGEKSKDGIADIRWKLKKGYDRLVDPIVLEPNTGKLRLKSGGVIDTGSRKYLIWDGHHRYEAHRLEGRKTIKAVIRTSKTIGQIE